MSDSDDSNSILPNLQKTRELFNQKSGSESADYLLPKSQISPTKATKTFPAFENHVNGTHTEEDIVRSDDRTEDDFDMPDVKSMKSQWEKPGPAPTPKKSAPVVVQRQQHSIENDSTPELVPVNRDQEETKEEYDVQLGKLREKFEKEAKASSARVIWSDGPRQNVSKAAVGEKKNIFETEIEAQKHHQTSKEGSVEMPTVELSSIKKQFEQRKDEKLVAPTTSTRKSRHISISSESSTSTTEIVRYDDPPAEEPKYEVEISSLRMRFEQAAAAERTVTPRSRPSFQKKVSETNIQKHKAPSQPESPPPPTEVVRASDAKYDEMIGEESVKDRLASLNSRYKAMTEAAKPQATAKNSFKRRSTTDLVIKKKVELEVEVPKATPAQELEIIRSPPAGTKEKPDYKASIDLEQARQLFEQGSQSPPRGRSSRSPSRSPQRRSPRSQSTPSPIQRGSRRSSASLSKSPSPSRQSLSSHSSGRSSPSSKGAKRYGEPDVVVLEHTEVNYYYDSNGTRLSTKSKSPDDFDQSADNMSNAEVIRPSPAGTKEEADYVPSVNMHSVRDMFENAKDEGSSRGRTPPKKTVVIQKQAEEESAGNSPERNPEIVRSTAAGTREEPQFELSIDLKSARSKFESPHRPENYVPKNRIKEREEEIRKKRAAVAAASPRSSESSESSGYEVVKTTEAGSKEKPDYQVDLKATKSLFEGGRAPVPVKRETSSTRKQPVDVKGEIIRPEPAGTKEVVEIHASSDIKSVKEKFESPNQAEEEGDAKRKSPIDIHEEARAVIRKEREVKEEVQKSIDEPEDLQSNNEPEANDEPESKDEIEVDSESEHTDTEGEVVLEQDSENEPREAASDVAEERPSSVSSEELVEKEEMVEETHEVVQEQEEDQSAPAAAVIPVRVAIPEDLNDQEVSPEPEPEQRYDTYEKVITYEEEAQHPAQSDSDSDKELQPEIEKESVQEIQSTKQVIDEDGLKQNGFKEENVDSSYESNEAQNHLDDSLSSEKGISSASSNQDDSQQQLTLSSSSPHEGEEIAADGEVGYLQ